MQHFIATFGNYTLELHNYELEYIQQEELKDYCDNKQVNLVLTTWGGRKPVKEENIGMHLKSIEGEIKQKDDKYFYDIDWTKFNLSRILFDILKRRKICCIGQVMMFLYEKERTLKYYLQSELGKDEVILSNKPHGKTYSINDYCNIEWIAKHGLQFNPI